MRRLSAINACLLLSLSLGAVDARGDETDAPQTTNWYPWTADGNLAGGALDAQAWLDKPAGRHGAVRMVGDHFELADHAPIKFWGTNLAYGSNCAPPKAVADATAARFAQFGINAVRLHKFTYSKKGNGICDENDSTRFDPQALDQLDYFASQLKNRGVYFGWSHTYCFNVKPGDRSKLLAYDEIVHAFPGGNTYAFIHFAPDVQDLLIDMVVNLLNHRNPHTGLRYSEEPALCFIELQNEDDIFFYTSDHALNACPTYKKHFMERFGKWLLKKYETREGLRRAWEQALRNNESPAEGTVAIQANPWFFSEDHLPGTAGGGKRRLLDTAAFFHEVQDEFYGKFVKAIRATGYKGPLNGSPWQAPSGLPELYNLKSDYQVGYIDRHNYFGGKLGDSMLGKPGSGYLSTGLQQVIDRPFGLSEWITVYPSLYSAEGPVLLAAYGMGLQGWDASYEFQSQARTRVYSDRVGTLPWGVWDADTPTQIGQYPLLARMIARGDVKESPVISIRHVADRDLADGTLNFSDKVTQQGDIKTFGGRVGPEALAAGRVVVQFSPSPAPSTFPDMEKFRQGDIITSATGQLKWDAGHRVVTINTPASKGFVGFVQGQEQTLANVHIASESPYASILLTAADRRATLETDRTALLCVMGRSCNSGFTVNPGSGKIQNNGSTPILMEPIKATITLKRPIKSVTLLDQDGKPTGKTIDVREGSFTVDGERDHSPYYEIQFQ